MPAHQHSVHRINELDSESSSISRQTFHSQIVVLQGFYEALPCLPHSCIHIVATQVDEELSIVPRAAVWMDVALMAVDGLPVGSSRGLLP